MNRLQIHRVVQRCRYMQLLLMLLAVAMPCIAQNVQEPNASIVVEGRANSVILLAAEAAAEEALAARELQEYLQKISGAGVEIRSVAPAALPAAARQIRADAQFPILMGQAASPETLGRLKAEATDTASFILKANANEIQVTGLSPQGTLFGVYELLEQLGVRWFMPGELGTVVPNMKTVALPQQETIQTPSFVGRWHGGRDFPEWARRVRMGGPSFPAADGVPGIKAADFKKHPEYFALVDGKRRAPQIDVSNPEVIRVVTEATRAYFRKNPTAQWIGMGPHNGAGFCECEQCRALDAGDWDPIAGQISLTDRYVWFFNKILDNIKDEFPDKKVGFYCYDAYTRPPVKNVPNPKIVPAFRPTSICRVHGVNNPVCPERSSYISVMESWNKLVPEMYERGHWVNMADSGFPFSEVHKLRDEIPTAHKLGLKGWRVETFNHWASETPTLYIAAKLMWNHKADVDALLADFYQKFFGPAEKPMAEYLTLMDTALRDADYHTGSSWDMPHFYPAALRKQARQVLDRAAEQAGTGVYAERIKLFRTSFDYLEAFIAMQEHSSRQEFAAAHQQLERVDALQKTLMAYDPPMLNPDGAITYLKRFFRQPVEQAYARTRGDNELVVALQDEWQFQLDPLKIGEEIGFWKAEMRGGNWRPLKTSSTSWSNQGLRTYKGEAWYRQEVAIPARFAGRRVFLWFGGVDEKAKVWVNGQPVGISHGTSFLPFELDATPAIKPGQRNVVTVRLANRREDELGTGGITAPVMFYAPAENSKLSNVRELSTTFP